MSLNDEPLRLIFATQSTGFNLFWNLRDALKVSGDLGTCGFFVTNRHEYTLFKKSEPQIQEESLNILKEWDLLDKARALNFPDLNSIAEWEKRLGDASLWNALIIDRRLGFPLKAQFRQCYESAYSHESLLKILQVALEAIDEQFNRVQPHAVLGLNAVTLYDYLYYLMARQRGIPYMQLKLTRVRNYVSWFTHPFELSPHIANTFYRYLRGNVLDGEDEQAWQEARTFIAASKGANLVYEGAVSRSSTTAKSAVKSLRPGKMSRFGGWLHRFLQALTVRDPHYPTLIYSMFRLRLVKMLRRRLQRIRFDIENTQVFLESRSGHYAIYPLNTEPEVALLAYGRPYRNQIETVRNLAAALPVGWKLVVKEHPNAYGYRSAGYYKKLQQIPNVLVASPQADTGLLTEHCSLVALVYGTIGLEALIKRKPLLIFSDVPYGIFSSSMVRQSKDPWRLGHDVRDLLENHRHDEKEIEAYLAAHVRTGIRINLFTGLLAKSGRQVGEAGLSLSQQYEALAWHTRERIAQEVGRHTEKSELLHA